MATTFFGGLRALHAPALRLCRQQLAVNSSRRSLSSTVFLRSPLAQTAPLSNITKDKNAREEGDPELVPFSSLEGKVSAKTLEAITVRPFKHTHMTTVQEAVFSMLPGLSIPPTMGEGGRFKEQTAPRDLMVRAKTGTGKTLAFLVPAIEARIRAIEEAGKQAAERAGTASDRKLEETAKKNYVNNHVGALILSPTRELAKQIVTEASKLTSSHGFNIHEFIGGESKGKQLRDWRFGRKDIVVATTGRLRDLMETSRDLKEALATTNLLILDEADTMLDLGFRQDIEAILPDLPPAPERQTFVFSATISKPIAQIARQSLSKNHIYINTISEEDSPVHEHIPQYHTVLPTAAEQIPHVLRLLAHDQLMNPGGSKTILFMPTTKMTQLFSNFLRDIARSVLPAGKDTMIYEIHSKRTQEQRSKTSDRFRNDKCGAAILVTSDVSARGVDYPGVTRVVQIGVPSSPEQYVHRVGRTGRTGGTNGRGDLVLLPWEHGFLQTELSHVPLKPITVSDLEKQVSEVAARHDEDPAAFFPVKPEFEGRRISNHGRERGPLLRFQGRVTSRLEGMPEEIKEVLSSAVEPEAVNEAFSSMLGYYVARSPELRINRDTILAGLREWAVQAVGLPEPPHVSENFLRKIGFSGNGGFDRKRNSSSFGRRDGGDRSGNRRFNDRTEENRRSSSFSFGDRTRENRRSGGFGAPREHRDSGERNDWPPRPRRDSSESGGYVRRERSDSSDGEFFDRRRSPDSRVRKPWEHRGRSRTAEE